MRLTDLAAGKHAVKLEKEGFLPWSQDIDVAQGRVVELQRAVLRSAAAAAAPAANRASLSGAAVPPKPRTPPAGAEAAPPPNDRPSPRPERPRLGKYDDLIGF